MARNMPQMRPVAQESTGLEPFCEGGVVRSAPFQG